MKNQIRPKMPGSRIVPVVERSNGNASPQRGLGT